MSSAIHAFLPDAPTRDGDTRGDRVRELTDKARERQPLRGLLLAGAASAPTVSADNRYFDALREQVRRNEGKTNGTIAPSLRRK